MNRVTRANEPYQIRVGTNSVAAAARSRSYVQKNQDTFESYEDYPIEPKQQNEKVIIPVYDKFKLV